MAQIDPALKQRATAAEKKREAFSALMKDIYRYAMPERDGWNSYALGADRSGRQVYDSTAVISTGRFANRLQQSLFPPQQTWCALDLPPEVKSADGAAVQLRDLELATHLVFGEITASNFDQSVNEWAMDLAAGVGCLLVENGRLSTGRAGAPLFRFQAVPAAMVAFDEGPQGTVEGVFVTQTLPARLVRRTYPDADIPDDLAQIERDTPEHLVELLQATVYDQDEDRWRMVIAERKGGEVLAERFYRTSPWIVTRWSKSPGEAYGRGPLAAALPDIRVLNKVMELYLAAASLDVYGVWTVADDGVVNTATLNIVPGAVIPVRSNGGAMGRTIDALRSGTNYAVAGELIERLQTNIRQILFDAPLPPEIQAGITATEIAVRQRQFQQDTGAFGRLQADAVTPLMVRLVDIADEAGLLAPKRFAWINRALRQNLLRVRSISPLAMAQDRADVEPVIAFLQAASALGPLGPQLIETGINMAAVGPWLAKRSGVPAELIPTADELAERQEQQQQQETTTAALQSPVLAQVAGNLAPAMQGNA